MSAPSMSIFRKQGTPNCAMSHENGIFGTIIFVDSEPLALERSINSGLVVPQMLR